MDISFTSIHINIVLSREIQHGKYIKVREFDVHFSPGTFSFYLPLWAVTGKTQVIIRKRSRKVFVEPVGGRRSVQGSGGLQGNITPRPTIRLAKLAFPRGAPLLSPLSLPPLLPQHRRTHYPDYQCVLFEVQEIVIFTICAPFQLDSMFPSLFCYPSIFCGLCL